MKRIFLHITLLLTTLCTLHPALCTSLRAQTAEPQDSIRISLLTCGAYDEVWTLYGHSALRINFPLTGEDLVANYGLFDFRRPFFIGRFVFGKCDYMMALVPFSHFIQEFSNRNASVFEQEINLTLQEKKDIINAVYINSLPENCVYRYNFFYDNCATRPRDIILNNTPDRIVYNNLIDTTLTFRQLIHQNNEQQRWCRLGNDLLLGVNADSHTTRHDQQFLPQNLMRDFADAQFIDAQGNKRPVVLRSQWILKDNATYTKGFPLTPFTCSLILLLAAIALSVAERKRGLQSRDTKEQDLQSRDTKEQGLQSRSIKLLSPTIIRAIDLTLFIAAGLMGLILLLMIFSEHPTVSLNLQILALNPLYILLLWRIIPEMRGKRKPYALALITACALAALICDTLLQDFAEGMTCLTATLLLRLRPHLVNQNN